MNDTQRELVTAIADKVRLVNVPAAHHTTLQDAMIFKFLQVDVPALLALVDELARDNQWFRQAVRNQADIIQNAREALDGKR